MLKGTGRCLTRLMGILMKLLLELSVRTFKVGLPSEHGLRKSLTGKPVTRLRQLMDRVDKYKRIEDDQQQGKQKAKVIP